MNTRTIALLHLLVWIAIFSVVDSRGVLSIKLREFHNPSGRTFDGGCCDEGRRTDDVYSVCSDGCDYVMRLIVSGLGRANDHVFLFHRPIKYNSNDVIFPHDDYNLVLTVLFDQWPVQNRVKMSAFFYDYDDLDHTTTLVDWFVTDLRNDTSGTAGASTRDGTTGAHNTQTIIGKRRHSRTRLSFEWSVVCNGGDECNQLSTPRQRKWPTTTPIFEEFKQVHLGKHSNYNRGSSLKLNAGQADYNKGSSLKIGNTDYNKGSSLNVGNIDYDKGPLIKVGNTDYNMGPSMSVGNTDYNKGPLLNVGNTDYKQNLMDIGDPPRIDHPAANKRVIFRNLNQNKKPYYTTNENPINIADKISSSLKRQTKSSLNREALETDATTTKFISRDVKNFRSPQFSRQESKHSTTYYSGQGRSNDYKKSRKNRNFSEKARNDFVSAAAAATAPPSAFRGNVMTSRGRLSNQRSKGYGVDLKIHPRREEKSFSNVHNNKLNTRQFTDEYATNTIDELSAMRKSQIKPKIVDTSKIYNHVYGENAGKFKVYRNLKNNKDTHSTRILDHQTSTPAFKRSKTALSYQNGKEFSNRRQNKQRQPTTWAIETGRQFADNRSSLLSRRAPTKSELQLERKTVSNPVIGEDPRTDIKGGISRGGAKNVQNSFLHSQIGKSDFSYQRQKLSPRDLPEIGTLEQHRTVEKTEERDRQLILPKTNSKYSSSRGYKKKQKINHSIKFDDQEAMTRQIEIHNDNVAKSVLPPDELEKQQIIHSKVSTPYTTKHNSSLEATEGDYKYKTNKSHKNIPRLKDMSDNLLPFITKKSKPQYRQDLTSMARKTDRQEIGLGTNLTNRINTIIRPSGRYQNMDFKMTNGRRNSLVSLPNKKDSSLPQSLLQEGKQKSTESRKPLMSSNKSPKSVVKGTTDRGVQLKSLESLEQRTRESTDEPDAVVELKGTPKMSGGEISTELPPLIETKINKTFHKPIRKMFRPNNIKILYNSIKKLKAVKFLTQAPVEWVVTGHSAFNQNRRQIQNGREHSTVNETRFHTTTSKGTSVKMFTNAVVDDMTNEKYKAMPQIENITDIRDRNGFQDTYTPYHDKSVFTSTTPSISISSDFTKEVNRERKEDINNKTVVEKQVKIQRLGDKNKLDVLETRAHTVSRQHIQTKNVVKTPTLKYPVGTDMLSHKKLTDVFITTKPTSSTNNFDLRKMTRRHQNNTQSKDTVKTNIRPNLHEKQTKTNHLKYDHADESSINKTRVLDYLTSQEHRVDVNYEHRRTKAVQINSQETKSTNEPFHHRTSPPKFVELPKEKTIKTETEIPIEKNVFTSQKLFNNHNEDEKKSKADESFPDIISYSIKLNKTKPKPEHVVQKPHTAHNDDDSYPVGADLITRAVSEKDNSPSFFVTKRYTNSNHDFKPLTPDVINETTIPTELDVLHSPHNKTMKNAHASQRIETVADKNRNTHRNAISQKVKNIHQKKTTTKNNNSDYKGRKHSLTTMNGIVIKANDTIHDIGRKKYSIATNITSAAASLLNPHISDIFSSNSNFKTTRKPKPSITKIIKGTDSNEDFIAHKNQDSIEQRKGQTTPEYKNKDEPLQGLQSYGNSNVNVAVDNDVIRGVNSSRIKNYSGSKSLIDGEPSKENVQITDPSMTKKVDFSADNQNFNKLANNNSKILMAQPHQNSIKLTENTQRDFNRPEERQHQDDNKPMKIPYQYSNKPEDKNNLDSKKPVEIDPYSNKLAKRPHQDSHKQVTKQSFDSNKSVDRIHQNFNKSIETMHRSSNKPMEIIHQNSNKSMERKRQDSNNPMEITQEDANKHVEGTHQNSNKPIEIMRGDSNTPMKRTHQDSNTLVERTQKDSIKTMNKTRQDSNTPLNRTHQNFNTPLKRTHQDSNKPREKTQEDFKKPLERTRADASRHFEMFPGFNASEKLSNVIEKVLELNDNHQTINEKHFNITEQSPNAKQFTQDYNETFSNERQQSVVFNSSDQNESMSKTLNVTNIVDMINKILVQTGQIHNMDKIYDSLTILEKEFKTLNISDRIPNEKVFNKTLHGIVSEILLSNSSDKQILDNGKDYLTNTSFEKMINATNNIFPSLFVQLNSLVVSVIENNEDIHKKYSPVIIDDATKQDLVPWTTTAEKATTTIKGESDNHKDSKNLPISSSDVSPISQHIIPSTKAFVYPEASTISSNPNKSNSKTKKQKSHTSLGVESHANKTDVQNVLPSKSAPAATNALHPKTSSYNSGTLSPMSHFTFVVKTLPDAGFKLHTQAPHKDDPVDNTDDDDDDDDDTLSSIVLPDPKLEREPKTQYVPNILPAQVNIRKLRNYLLQIRHAPKVRVPTKGLFEEETATVPRKEDSGISSDESLQLSAPAKKRHQADVNLKTVFKRYWPALFGIAVGTVFLLTALVTSLVCRQRRLLIQSGRWTDSPQHLSEPPDTSEYATSSATSLHSDFARSSSNLM